MTAPEAGAVPVSGVGTAPICERCGKAPATHAVAFAAWAVPALHLWCFDDVTKFRTTKPSVPMVSRQVVYPAVQS